MRRATTGAQSQTGKEHDRGTGTRYPGYPRTRAVNGLLPRGPGLDADRAAAEQRGACRLAANRAGAGAALSRGSRVPALAVRARVRPAHRAEPSARRFPDAQKAPDRPRGQGDRSPTRYAFRPLVLPRPQWLPLRGARTGEGPGRSDEVTGGRPTADPSVPADSQRIGDAVDVVEPGGDQGDLEPGLVVETDGTQPFVIQGRDLGSVPGQLDDVIDHDPLGLGDWGRLVVLTQRLDKIVIQGDPTQKLCVRDNSVMALVGQGDHGGDHLVLPALQWQLGRHERAEG